MLLSACVLCFAGLGRAEKAGEVLEAGPDSRFRTIRDALVAVPERLTVPHLVRVHGGRYAPFANCFFTFPRNVPGWRSRAFVGKYGLNVCDDLREWQLLSGQDRHSLFADPVFCGAGLRGKPVVTDAHLQSTAGAFVSGRWTVSHGHSPAIDARDPKSSFDAEPEPDGGRINMGAFGGTREASKSNGPGGEK